MARFRVRSLPAVAFASTLLLAVAYVSAIIAQTGNNLPPCNPPGSEFVTVKVVPPGGPEFKIENVPWISDETVALAMSNARHVNANFTYDTTDYCPYGRFVTAVNGLTESGPYYWFLYVNDQQSDQGMDTKRVKSGDVIAWKAETFSPTSAPTSHQALAIAHRAKRRLDAVAKSQAK